MSLTEIVTETGQISDVNQCAVAIDNNKDFQVDGHHGYIGKMTKFSTCDYYSINRIVITTRSRFINPLNTFPSRFFQPYF